MFAIDCVVPRLAFRCGLDFDLVTSNFVWVVCPEVNGTSNPSINKLPLCSCPPSRSHMMVYELMNEQ